MGALAATGQTKYQEAFQPLPEGFKYARFNDFSSWEKAITPQTCAFFLELVQGEGGVNPATPEFLQGLAALDRKSTRLNSSHVRISYAVFCLKKKKKNKQSAQ